MAVKSWSKRSSSVATVAPSSSPRRDAVWKKAAISWPTGSRTVTTSCHGASGVGSRWDRYWASHTWCGRVPGLLAR